jgi:hypothetical protein
MKPQNPSALTPQGIQNNSFYKTLRGNISFGTAIEFDSAGAPSEYAQDNCDGILIRVGAVSNPFALSNFWSGSNSNTVIKHNLGRVPIGYIITAKNKTCDVYTGTVAPTSSQITLRCTDGTADTTVYIF